MDTNQALKMEMLLHWHLSPWPFSNRVKSCHTSTAGHKAMEGAQRLAMASVATLQIALYLTVKSCP